MLQKIFIKKKCSHKRIIALNEKELNEKEVTKCLSEYLSVLI